MQQLELFPELNMAEPYIGVKFMVNGEVYISSPAEYIDLNGVSDCTGCAFICYSTSFFCNKAEDIVNCHEHPIIWVKKG